MFLTILSGILVFVCLVSSLILYVFIRSQSIRRSSQSSLNEKHQIRYSFRPSIDLITKKLSEEFSFRSSITSSKSDQSSTNAIHQCDDKSFFPKKTQAEQHRSAPSINLTSFPNRSASMATNFETLRRPRSVNWRQGSIVDSNQMALIEFSLPPHHSDLNKYRRRSVPISHDIILTKDSQTTQIDGSIPFLLTFSLNYLKTSQIQVEIHSCQGLPMHLHLQQLNIKVKIYPDGKEKTIQWKKLTENENQQFDDRDQRNSIVFSNISAEKLIEKSFLLTINGKDQTKKNFHLGQIGKIHLNQFQPIIHEQKIDLTHQVEKMKKSSMELLVALEKKHEHYLHIELQRMKGIKVDQKNLDATGYLRVVLLDRHRPLTSHQTKPFRLNSATNPINEQYDLNILTYHSNNFDRLMILISFYSNGNQQNEHRCIARIKLASPHLASDSGTIHWQQFKARESFSMWHTFNKYQSN